MSRTTDVPRVDFDAQREIPARYSALLQTAAGGHALFEPAAQDDEGGIIGDGGYINKGAFYRLFNAFTDPPTNVPSVAWNAAQDISTRMRDNSSVLKSSSASTVQFRASLSVESNLLPLLGVPPVSIEPVVRLKEADFAFLALAGREREVSVLKEPRRTMLKEWLSKHYEALYALYRVDIVIICETVRSSGWVGGLAYHDTREISADVQVTVPGLADVGVGFTRGREVQVDLVSTRGPNPDNWTAELPPNYTVIVGLIVARRRIMARIRRRLLLLRTPTAPPDACPPSSESQRASGTNESSSQESSTSNWLSGRWSSLTLTRSTSGTPSTPSAAAGDDSDAETLSILSSSESDALSLLDIGDETLLHTILDGALAEHEDADIAVADWSLITNMVEECGDASPDFEDVQYDVAWQTRAGGGRLMQVKRLVPRGVFRVLRQEAPPVSSRKIRESVPAYPEAVGSSHIRPKDFPKASSSRAIHPIAEFKRNANDEQVFPGTNLRPQSASPGATGPHVENRAATVKQEQVTPGFNSSKAPGNRKQQAIRELFNELERRALPREFSWKEKHIRPGRSLLWQLDLFINDVHCGRGFGRRKKDAKHAACAQYLDILRSYPSL